MRNASPTFNARLAVGMTQLFLVLMGMTGCDRTTNKNASSDILKVFVTIQPQAYFVERVGGSHVDVGVMVGPGQSYHTYEPMPRQIEALADATLYFKIGVPFEASLTDKIASTHPRLKFIDTQRDIRLRAPVDCGHDHSEDDHGHHHEDDGDPHIWLDPMLVKTQARTIADALTSEAPAYAEDFKRNLAAFESDLDAVHAKIAERLTPYRGRSFFVFHPSFGYFGDAYGLKQVGVEEAGKEPSARRITELVRQARQEGVRVIFVQPQFAASSAEAVAREIRGRVVTLDPLAKDYLANLNEMADKIAMALKETDASGDSSGGQTD